MPSGRVTSATNCGWASVSLVFCISNCRAVPVYLGESFCGLYGHGQLWDRRWRLTFSKGLAIANNIGLEQASKHPDECCFASRKTMISDSA